MVIIVSGQGAFCIRQGKDYILGTSIRGVGGSVSYKDWEMLWAMVKDKCLAKVPKSMTSFFIDLRLRSS